MGKILNWLASPLGGADGTPANYPTITVDELAGRYDVIEASDGMILYQDRPEAVRAAQATRIPPVITDALGARESVSLAEVGSTGQSTWMGFAQEDYNPDLVWPLNLEVYDKMRRSDGVVRGTMRMLKTPILSARWFVEPGDETERGYEIADWVQQALMESPYFSWKEVLTEILLQLEYGLYIFEKVYAVDPGSGDLVLRKLAPRHPVNVAEFQWDRYGELTGVKYNVPDGRHEVLIRADKMLVFTFEKEGGDVRGLSALRSAYPHWYYKQNLYKIDAIQKERHGIGVPCIKLPVGWKPADKTAAQEMGRNLRANEKSYVVIPPNFEVSFLKVEGNLTNALESAEHHSEQMYRNILADFILGTAGEGAAKVGMEIFTKSVAYIADTIRDVINRDLIREMVIWQFGEQEPGKYPQLRVRRIGDTTDWRTLSFAIRNFVGAKVIIPDEKLETFIRDELDLPRMDHDTSRETDTKQLPGSAGPPRQAPATEMEQGKNAGKSNTGQDQSGG